MPEHHIRYDLLAQQALRGVVRTVLADVAKKGLPGEHHFKITFATAAPGVRLSERMRGQYPDAMTIVLQHRFWDLSVEDDGFEVAATDRAPDVCRRDDHFRAGLAWCVAAHGGEGDQDTRFPVGPQPGDRVDPGAVTHGAPPL